MKKKVAIQGIGGCNHYIAAKDFFGEDEIETIDCNTFKELAKLVADNRDILGIMAIENTIAGSILQNYRLLRENRLSIVGEYKLRISHSLAALPGVKMEDIREINSHPMALMQCAEFLERFPAIKLVEKDDTAGSAKWISDNQLKDHAAICPSGAAKLYGMNILAEGIETNKRNFTRFLILSNREVSKEVLRYLYNKEKNRNLHVNEESALQARRNREEYEKNITLYRSSILRLTEQIHNCIQVHSQMETEGARSGKLDISRVWRAEVLGDGRVFSRQFPADKPGFSVDILLDASASRMKSQETIAAQGYILAESLRMCKVPVRVTGFCSLSGYTVLRIFKTFQDKNGGSRIFDYFASGWNRDGLALRGAGELLKNTPAERKLLLVLTDASPNDIHRIPPGNDHPLGCDYSGKAAVEDAAREVRALKKENVRVGAIFTGENMDVPAAEEIYGKNMARISTMDQLAGAAGALIRKEIQELTG